MYLEQLDIQGFKSFAKKTTLQFKKQSRHVGTVGITAIVGPNGSGKSNIADAIRWVLGEQSMKMLRGKKSEDVIFSGSEKRTRLGMAEVTLTLNNEDRSASIDYTQVAVTRQLTRDGASTYFINKNKVRLQDIQLLLAKANFGQRTYSVIGQGMVDEILMVSPKERKDFFDEAAGVKQYLMKKEQAEQKLNITEDNLRQAELLIQEIDPQLRSLTRQVKRLERREAIEKELQELQKQYYGTIRQTLDTQRTQTQQTLTGIESQRKEREQMMRDIQKTLSALEQKETTSEAFLTLQKQYEALVQQRHALREQIFETKQEILRTAQQHEGKTPPVDIIKIQEVLHALLTEYDTILDSLERVTTDEERQTCIKELHRFKNRLRAAHDLTTPKTELSKTREPEQKNIEALTKTFEELQQKIKETEESMRTWSEEEQKEKKVFFTLQRQLQEHQSLLHTILAKENEQRVALARLEQRTEDLEREMHQEGFEKQVLNGDTSFHHPHPDALIQEIEKRKKQRELIGGTDPEVVSEYEKVKERHTFLTEQSQDLKEAMEKLHAGIEELEETIKEKFDASFAHINEEFQKFFKTLFRGGTAKLVLVKETPQEEEMIEHVEEEKNRKPNLRPELRSKKIENRKSVIAGIDIHATPPGKRLKGIGMLSGGERALTSIALICAFISNNPAPFVVLDEVDAALDEANSERFASILDELSHKTQFVVVTHNRSTMLKSVALYGVTMGDDGVSKVLSLSLEEAKETSSTATSTATS